MKFTTLLIILFPFHCFSLEIYSTKDQKFLNTNEFINSQTIDTHYVLGEYHYDKNIIQSQKEFIDLIVGQMSLQGNFTVGWEFLLYKDNDELQKKFNEYKKDLINEKELIESFFYKKSGKNTLVFDPMLFLSVQNSHNKNNNFGNHHIYSPLFQITKEHNGQFIALNEERKIKRYISKGGINNLPSKYLPEIYEIGSSNYLKRFKDAMGGHVPENTIMNYFEAQSFTDSVMSTQFDKLAKHDTRFTIVGSFHSDYNDAYVRELKKVERSKIVTIKVINRGLMSNGQWLDLIKESNYGHINDYIIFQ